MTALSKLASAAGLLLIAACGGEADDAPAPTAAASAEPVGESAYRPCAVCHATAPRGTKAGDVKLIGPNLHGVYGDPAASLDGFSYSPAMKTSGVVWDEASLDAFIANPQKFVRGTRMAFVGEPNAEKRAAIIEYLKGLE